MSGEKVTAEELRERANATFDDDFDRAAYRIADLERELASVREALEDIIVACDDATRAPIASDALLADTVRRRVNRILDALSEPNETVAGVGRAVAYVWSDVIAAKDAEVAKLREALASTEQQYMRIVVGHQDHIGFVGGCAFCDARMGACYR